jgi:hypothetical protein
MIEPSNSWVVAEAATLGLPPHPPANAVFPVLSCGYLVNAIVEAR